MKKAKLSTSRTAAMTVPTTVARQDAEQQDAEKRTYVALPTGARMLDVSVPTLRRLLTEGKLTRFKFGGRTLIKTSELLGLVKAAE